MGDRKNQQRERLGVRLQCASLRAFAGVLDRRRDDRSRPRSSDRCRWRHRYKDITSVSPQGRFLLDYSKFNEVVAEE
jgi:hypothetical protein